MSNTIVNRHYLRVAPDCSHHAAVRIDALPPLQDPNGKDRYYCPTCDVTLTGTEYHADRAAAATKTG
jgi:hypothetical protein